MPDTDLNLTVDVRGNTAAIATDYTTSGITNAHVQIIKLAYGSPTTATRVTTSTPLPVDLRSSTPTLGISGNVSGVGNFSIINGISGSQTLPIIISGTTSSSYTPVQINGFVQGVTNGIPVAITGSVSLFSGGRIQGLSGGDPITITGGRPLNSTRDTVGVTGTVTISGGRYLAQTTDNVRIYGAADGSTIIPISLRDGNGTIIGSSGGALNVNLVGTGFTATVNVSTLIGICQANQSVPFFVAGATSGPALRVKGSLGANEAVEVGWSDALKVKTDPNYPLHLNLSTVLAAIGTDLQNGTLTDIVDNTNTIKTISNKLSDATAPINVNVISTSKPAILQTGTITNISTTPNPLASNVILRYGVTLKASPTNTSAIQIFSLSSSTTGAYPLDPGEILFLEIGNLNMIRISCSYSAAVLHYIAS